MSLSRVLAVMTLGLCAALTVPSAFGHHSRAMYDTGKTVEVTGVVKEFQFNFPHTFLLVDVTGPDGKVVTWAFEAGGPPAMSKIGVRKSTLPVGERVKVTAAPIRPGGGDPNRGLWKEVTRLSDGKVFPLGSAV